MTTHLDDVLIKFNMFGPYYVKCTVFIFVAYVFHSMHCSNFIFIAEESGYRCKDVRFSNNTCSSLDNGKEVCTEWVYDVPNSFMAEFQLACQEWKRTLFGTVHSIGTMAGLIIIGPLSDRIGRKKVIVMSGVLSAVLGVSRSFTTRYWWYLALEFLEAAIGDTSSPIFMMTIEMVAHEKRLMFQLISGFGFSLGFLTLPLAAWLVPYWRNLLRVIYSPAIILITYYFLLDESPRWLLSRGYKEESINILKKIAKKNKTKLDENILSNLSYEETKDIEFTELLAQTFTSKPLLKRFFICQSWWIVSTFVNCGLEINSVSLEGNKYINFGLLGPIDLFGNWLIVTLMTKYRRKWPLFCSFVLSAVFCFVQPFMPTVFPWLSISIFMISKLMSSAYFTNTYIYTSELFPTYTRNSMHALCSSLGRLGSIVAPQTPLLMAYWKGLPSMIFGLTSFGAAIATLWAPDTANDSLPDTVHQAEELGKRTETLKQSDGVLTLVSLPIGENITRL